MRLAIAADRFSPPRAGLETAGRPGAGAPGVPFARRLAQAAEEKEGKTGRAAPAAADPGALAALRDAAKDFEAYFLQYLMKGLRRTVPGGGLIDTGFAGELYEEMYDQSLAEAMADAGGIGLADMLVEQLADHVGRTA